MKAKLFSFLTVILLSIGASYAEKVQIGDLYYNLNESELTAEVTQSDDNYSNLTTVTIPTSVSYSENTYSVTKIGNYAFYACSNLTSVTIPTSVTNIEGHAFQLCNALSSVNISEKVTDIGIWAFAGCSNLFSIDIPNSVKNLGGYAFSGSGLTSVNIPNSVISIGDYIFNGCTNLKSVSLGNSVTSIGAYAFYNCYGLTSITIPNSVSSIETEAFKGCYGLTTMYVDEGNNVYDSRENCNAIINTASNTLIAGCQNTIIPNSVTGIGTGAFYGCSGLTSITIPNSVNSIESYAFAWCNNLNPLFIPNSVTNIESYAFEYCINMTSISVEEGNTRYDSRKNCNAIIETASNTLIAGCQNTIIPNSVTGIGTGAFSWCQDLKSITIPNSVTSIGDKAFQYCGLLTITCEATTPPILGTKTFDIVDKSTPVKVPEQSIVAYQAAEGWKEFTNIQPIKAIVFPGDPGTLTLNLELKAAVMDGEELQGYTPTGGGGYAKGSSVTITAQDIPGYEFVRWSDENTEKTRTIVLKESMTLTALYSHSMIEIPVAAGKWNFICLPPLGDRQYTEDMFTYDGLTDVQWGTYNGIKRAAGQSGWETPETFNAMQGYIIYSSTTGTLRINAYEDEIRQGESGNTIHAGMIDYASSHAQNANWNFMGNPYPQGYNIAGFAAADITSPITVWNGTAYTTYTPGIDSYILNPFEAFFIQKSEGSAEGITFNPEYLEGADGGNSDGVADAMGTLPGYFSVSATQQIQFSKGNLQYQASTDTWRFAENQYDTICALNANISATYDGWIDLFGWGTGNNPTISTKDNNDYSTFVDWGTNAISNGGNEANLWRTLTMDEWVYLFETRANASALYGQATVNGITGMIILPDDWQSVVGITFTSGTGDYRQNKYTLEQWSSLESAGAVFLPAAGSRYGTNVNYVGSNGYSWSSSPNDSDKAYTVVIGSSGLEPQHYAYRDFGYSVRLVR